ncbi:MAG TPA: S-methyl-5-thioribose-1-phosphate isomerase [Chloroflexota bacterium]
MRTLEYVDGVVRLIDQTQLPTTVVTVECRTSDDLAAAIRGMKVRGAPAIGVAAVYAMALGARAYEDDDVQGFLRHMDAVAQTVRQTRPTAVNLFWGIERAMEVVRQAPTRGVGATVDALLTLAARLADEDVLTNQRMGAHGAALVPDGANILTHCNTGGLATVDYGTALGVVRAAHEQGKRVHVWVDETRPFLQGARLTAWELQQLGVPQTLVTDNMAGHLMARGKVDLVLVGADRIAANGDVANKIGTYSLAVLAKEHGIPFYVVAPTSTVDLSLPSGQAIPIEERSPEEVTTIRGVRIAPEGVAAYHPAFDVTPARYVSAIVTEVGVLRPPYEVALARAVQEGKTARVAS